MKDDYNFLDNSQDNAGETPNIRDTKVQPSNKVMYLIFLVDTSGSMGGERITALNNAFKEIISELAKRDKKEETTSYQVAIMRFDNDASWITRPVSVSSYVHEPITVEHGMTNYANAFRELNEQLSRTGFMKHEGLRMAQPYIAFLTDGAPSDPAVYPAELDNLKRNDWFNSSVKMAFLVGREAVGSDEARRVAGQFTGDPNEGVIDIANASAEMSKLVAKTLVTASILTQLTEAPKKKEPQEKTPPFKPEEHGSADAGSTGGTTDVGGDAPDGGFQPFPGDAPQKPIIDDGADSFIC